MLARFPLNTQIHKIGTCTIDLVELEAVYQMVWAQLLILFRSFFSDDGARMMIYSTEHGWSVRLYCTCLSVCLPACLSVVCALWGV